MAPVTTLRSFLPAELCLRVEQHSTVAIFSSEDASSKPYACLSLLRQVHISISQEPATYDKFQNVRVTERKKEWEDLSSIMIRHVPEGHTFFPFKLQTARK